jgi:hypothetical protein
MDQGVAAALKVYLPCPSLQEMINGYFWGLPERILERF